MSVEDLLRDSLTDRADRLGYQPDPWARFSAAERVHRAQRRRRGAAALAAAVAVGAVVQTVGVPLPGRATLGTVAAPVSATPTPSTPGAMLHDAPPRGSLAGDKAWQDGLRALPEDVEESEGMYRVGDRRTIQVLFAGDVPGRRLALLLVPLRRDGSTFEAAQWFEGPVGATAAQMEQRVNEEPQDVHIYSTGDDRDQLVVVVGPPSTQVEVSVGVRFGADGRLDRSWRRVGADGIGWLQLPPSRQVPQVAARVMRDGRLLYDRPVGVGGASEAPPQAATLPAEVVRATRGGPPSGVLLQTALEDAFATTGLDPRTTQVRVPWAGTVRGQDALVMTLQPQGGGVLAFSHRLLSRDDDSMATAQDLRLLLPAEGAAERPLAGRLRADSSEEKTSSVVVVAPEGATRVDLVAGGRTTPVALDVTGAGLTELDPGTDGVVRAYRSDGSLVGELPVPPFEDDMSGVPGSTRGTRIVD